MDNKYKRSFSKRSEDDIFYREMLIQDITVAMNTLRKKYPEVVIKLYFSPGQAMEDAGGTYIDGLDCVFAFNE